MSDFLKPSINLIELQKHRAGILVLILALAASGCGQSSVGTAGSGGSAGMGGSAGEGGTGGAPPFCTDMPAATPCGEDGEICDGEGQCVVCTDGEDCFSNGNHGAFLADEDIELPGGEYDFTSFVIESGVTVRVTGSEPLIIRTQNGASIDGVLTADGANGTDGVPGEASGIGGAGVAGGYDGGNGSFSVDEGPLPASAGLGTGAGGGGTDWGPGAGASHGSTGGNAALGEAVSGRMYGDPTLSILDGGSGAGGGSGGLLCGGGGGGAGGGIIKLSVLGPLSIGPQGELRANGGDGGTDGNDTCGGGGGGSGGTIWLQAGSITNDGLISAQGGVGFGGGQSNINPGGGYGRIRVDTSSQAGSGFFLPPFPHEGAAWYTPAPQ